MKDRIRKIMESQHMTQQTFAQFIQMSPASLSSIFNGRTKPTLNIIEAIKQKIPAISTDWLLFGRGPMYVDQQANDELEFPVTNSPSGEQVLDFGMSPSTSSAPSADYASGYRQGVGNTPKNGDKNILKYFDKTERKITEIRIFFDDQTWESFVPKK